MQLNTFNQPSDVAAGSRCPRHGTELSGGPVVWHCPDGHAYGHRVQAADLDREVHARSTRPARARTRAAA